MALIKVANPPHRRRHRNHRRAHRNARKKRHLTASQRAVALKNLIKARAARFGKKIRNAKRRKAHRRHKVRRHRRSRSFVNPFAGSLMTVGNPRRHHKRRKQSMAHRRHHRRRHSNPGGSLMAPVKEMVSADFIMEAAGVAAGFVLPGVVMNYVPASWTASKPMYYVVKVGTVVALSMAARMISKKVSNFILIGGGVSILLDIWTEFMGATAATPAATTPAPATTPATGAYYGGPISAYYGSNASGMSDFDIP